jgi:hypothetical protein
MTVAVSCIVEGDGEVAAVPVLLRRLGLWLTPAAFPAILPPIRVRKDRFLNREDEFNKYLKLASAKCGPAGWVLILLDADDDCPARSGTDIFTRARSKLAHARLGVVLANREYEAWFIAGASSLNGCRGFVCGENDAQTDAELHRNAKEWIKQRMAAGAYGISDQAAFSARIDLELVRRRSRSFRKLCAEWQRHMPA